MSCTNSCSYALASAVPTNEEIDSLWLIVNAEGVFLMQIGFLLLEVGTVRASHAKAICVKNTVDFLICTVGWLILGYGLAFGCDDCGYFAGNDRFFADDMSVTGPEWSTWFFQWSFASTACTIVSGSGAERCSFHGYVMSTVMLSSTVYPIIVHWVWSGKAWLYDGSEDDIKFYDFAGSGVVHMVGGTAAFVLASTIGPRDGRFSKSGVQTLQPHNMVIAAAGTLLIVAGWFCFNGGSVLAASGGNAQVAARVCAMTAIGAACGGIAAFFIVFLQSRFISLPALLNGILGGCVGITAGCSLFTPAGSMITGLLAGGVYICTSETVLWLEVDDPLDAFAVHGVCGMWGLLTVGIFGAGGDYGRCGIFYCDSPWDQFKYQLVGLFCILGWTGTVTGCVFQGLKLISPTILRVPLDIELSGDLVLYGGSAYPSFSAEATPPDGDMCMVSTDVQDSTALWEWNEEVMKASVEMHFVLLRDNIKRFNGYECMDEGDSLTIAFHNSFEAIKFCMCSQEELMKLAWPEELYDHPSGAKDKEWWCGLRIRMAQFIGHGKKFLNATTNRISYSGPCLEGVAALLKAIEAGGIVVLSGDSLGEIQSKYNHRLNELPSEINVQDLGKYELPKMDQVLSLAQVMPVALAPRPASGITCERQLTKGFHQAPGVGSEGKDVTFMFMAFKGLGEGMEKETRAASLSDSIFEIIFPREGYVTKDSNGIFLMSFHSVDSAIAFTEDVAGQITDLTFTCGVHIGVPTSVAANKASGRADYLGPPVNATARLMALAGDKKDMIGGSSCLAVSEVAANSASNSKGTLTQLEGKFNMKGVSEAMTVFGRGF